MTNIPCRKIIKASIFILIGFPFCDLLAQTNTRGIYNSWQDYNSNKLSLILNCNSPKNKIKLHHFFCGNYIDIIENGKQFRFKKDSIFGYRDCRQNDFRFYHNNEKEYRIAENSSIIIYVADVPVIASSGKTRTLVPAYFFSTTLNGEIYPLTILNLKKAFKSVERKAPRQDNFEIGCQINLES